jgi:hypothetical protein
VHVLNRADLLLRELVGPLEVVDLDLAGIGGRLDALDFRLARVDGGEKLVYLIL